MATLSPDFDDFLPGWISTQRWYRGTGRTPLLRRIGGIRWEDPLGEVGLEDHLLVDESGPEPVVYQVPLSYRAEPVAFLAHALVATAEHAELGTRYVYDAAHDPVFAQTLLQHVWSEHDVPSARARPRLGRPAARHLPGPADLDLPEQLPDPAVALLVARHDHPGDRAVRELPR